MTVEAEAFVFNKNGYLESYDKNYLIVCKMDHLGCRRSMMKLFLKSIDAVDPAMLISDNLKLEKGKLHISHAVYDIALKSVQLIGFGKAVLKMAVKCEKILGQHLKSGVICCPLNIQNMLKEKSDITLKPNSVIKVFEGAESNLPDENAEKGTSEIIALVNALDSKKDHLIVLISGGGSALCTKPKSSILLTEKTKTIKLLMESGADIRELNAVRRKISLVKGGGLACLSYPVRTTCLIISDVIGDPLDVIASGPTVPSSDSDAAAFNVIQKYNLKNKIPASVLMEIEKISEKFPIPIENNKFPHVDNFIIGNNWKALNVSKEYAQKLGFESIVLSDKVSGNVKNVSDFYSNMVFEILDAIYKEQSLLNKNLLNCCFNITSNIFEELNSVIKKQNDIKKICIIAGGETTVEVEGDGKGGRNQELALLTSVKINKLKIKNPYLFNKYEVEFLMAGTDGIDGPTDAAGAMGGSFIIEKAAKQGINIDDILTRNDSYNFFRQIDNGSWLIKTGHTGTNVMDIHIIIIYQKLT